MCVSAGWVWGEHRKALVRGGRRGQRGDSREKPVGFSPPKIRCAYSRCLTYLSMFWSSITDVFLVDNNFQQSLVVKKPSEEEEARQHAGNVRFKS